MRTREGWVARSLLSRIISLLAHQMCHRLRSKMTLSHKVTTVNRGALSFGNDLKWYERLRALKIQRFLLIACVLTYLKRDTFVIDQN